ncbi:CPBP family intramembrane glutamic endopeptidase [Microlunatus sp. GCM10028923]|uniref:CPBP family intramembrane glutamic endopeptidase n=1 Tax=Microlunatus sp. GCM10028923 TaxID=3273400 RepID=UPI00360ED940
MTVAKDVSAAPTTGAAAPVNYLRSLRDGARWWKALVIIAVVVVSYLLINVPLSLGAFALEAALRGVTMGELMTQPVTMTPLIFSSALLSLVALLPISLLLYRLLFPQQPLGTLFSVAGRFRWRWAGRALLIAMITIGGISAAILAVEPRVLLTEAGPTPNPLPWLIVALTLMPLQAAAEEITFRGLFGRSVGGLFARAGVGTVVALIVSSVAFGSAHLAGDPWLIAYYFLFGLLMGIVAWRTGGIEASVVLHVVNNVLVGGIGAVLDRSIESGIDRSMGAGSPLILVHLGTLVLTAVVLIIVHERDRGRSGRVVAAESSPVSSVRA